MKNLREIARVIRSKNSSPMKLTLDIIFKDRPTFEEVKKKNLISKAVIAKAYQLPESQIEKVIYFDPALAVKIGMNRLTRSGSPGDTDVYGAQQHAPLLGIELDV
ncbi:MAG: DUF4387 domain-containing protein [Holophagaceae bacterium]|nr:DUF4387 domain-containing protein [Holophagaceae bacterium]